MYVIDCILFADSMYGQLKFASIIRFGGCLDVVQQCEHEQWDVDDNAIGGHLCRVQLHQLLVQKSNVWLITSSNCPNTSFVDGRSAPSITTFITS